MGILWGFVKDEVVVGQVFEAQLDEVTGRGAGKQPALLVKVGAVAGTDKFASAVFYCAAQMRAGQIKRDKALGQVQQERLRFRDECAGAGRMLAGGPEIEFHLAGGFGLVVPKAQQTGQGQGAAGGQ